MIEQINKRLMYIEEHNLFDSHYINDMKHLLNEVERLKGFDEIEKLITINIHKENKKLREALATIESIKYNNLAYSSEDAQCMNDIARQALKEGEQP